LFPVERLTIGANYSPKAHPFPNGRVSMDLTACPLEP
jgi:hypothetical protein